MKTQMNNLILVGTAFIVFSLSLFAEPMGTAFTYQGRLLEDGQPAVGTYDLQCKLFDAQTGNTQIGDTLILEDGTTDNGYFTVEMDFGVAVFDGQRRYLELAIRPWDSTDPADFVVLSERVELTPTPYALQTRGIYVDPNLLVGIGTNAPAQKLHIADAGTTSLLVHNTADNVIGQLQADDTTVSLQSLFNHPLRFSINDTEWMRLDLSGNIGIGTKHPIGSLYSDSKTLEIEGNAPSIVLDDTQYTFQDDFEISNGGEKVLFRDATEGIDIMTLGLTGDIEGKVGIGTTNPQSTLEVNGTVHAAQDITKSYTDGTRNPAAPVAYGFVLFNGTLQTGTPNITNVV